MITSNFLKECGAPIVVATHMRSGTHLTMDILRRHFKGCRSWKFPGEANDALYLALDVLSGVKAEWGEKRTKSILKRAKRPLLKVHWTDPDLGNLRERQPYFADWLEEAGTFLHVVRNPYKVMASLWAWELSESSTDKIEKRPDIPWVQRKIRYWKTHCEKWQARSGVQLIRFEDIVKDTEDSLRRLAKILDEESQNLKPMLPAKLRGIWHSRFNRVFVTRPQSTEILTSFKATGVDRLFSEDQKDVVRAVAGDIMRDLGY